MKEKILCLCFCLLLILPVSYVVATNNEPPNPPIITGPKFGKVGELYEYTFTSTDPNGDDIQYYIEWGDGTFLFTLDSYPSGEGLTIGYKYPEKGYYTIRAKAQDVYNEVSDWGTLKIVMPKTKTYFDTPFIRFLEQHPYLFPILRQLLGL